MLVGKDDCLNDEVRLQQDGAPRHYDAQVRRSLDLSPLEYFYGFMWKTLFEKLYQSKF